MGLPDVTDKAGWERLTDNLPEEKGVLCSAYRLAAKRVHDVKGLGKRARDAVKAADERLNGLLNLIADGDANNPAVTWTALHDAILTKREATAGVESLEYHFLEVFMETAKVRLKARHATTVSVSSKDGGVTFKNGA